MPRPALSTQKLRDMIKSQELIEKAQKSVLDPNEPELSNAAVGVIKLLLNKTLPDLKGIEVSGNIDSEITRKHRVSFRRG